MIRLQAPSYDKDEILEVMESLLSTYVSMGKKNILFEEKWNTWLGSVESSTCNSGSSANLLIFSVLKSPLSKYDLRDGDEVIVPAIGWSTTYAPIIQNNLKCRIVDVKKDTLTIDENLIEKTITSKTKAIMCVHLLGNPCNMDKILNICKQYNLILIEDCCESHGATYNGKKVGTFGLASSFSFMFAHHISTAEGGMVSTNDLEFNDSVRIIRAHGWLRDIKDKKYKEKIESQNQNVNKDYLFVDLGYNLRMNDLGASFGIHQVDKLDNFISIRRNNHFNFIKEIKEAFLDDIITTISDSHNSKISPLALPIICKSKKIKQKILENFDGKVEYRGIASGNIIRQPFIKHYKNSFIYDECPNADYINDNGFWIGNHQAITENDYFNVCKLINNVV